MHIGSLRLQKDLLHRVESVESDNIITMMIEAHFNLLTLLASVITLPSVLFASHIIIACYRPLLP